MGGRHITTSRARSIQNARLVRGNHVLDIDERVLSTVGLEELHRFLDEVADVHALALAVPAALALITAAKRLQSVRGQGRTKWRRRC